jgi:hypothetical protein
VSRTGFGGKSEVARGRASAGGAKRLSGLTFRKRKKERKEERKKERKKERRDGYSGKRKPTADPGSNEKS